MTVRLIIRDASGSVLLQITTSAVPRVGETIICSIKDQLVEYSVLKVAHQLYAKMVRLTVDGGRPYSS